MDEKVFVIFNTTSIGDVLVTNTLVQNIKLYYPESKIVFVCNTPIYDVAKYQYGVSDVITFSKTEHTSFKGIFSFVKNFPYKKPFASFVTYSNERNLLISRLIGAKHIISHHKFKLWNTSERFQLKDYSHMKDKWGGMIEALTNEHKNLPIKYIPPVTDSDLIQSIKKLERPVVLCTTSNYEKKDMKIEDCTELIRLLKAEGYTPVLTGAGDVARKFSDDLKKAGCLDFVDIVNCTSFIELANVLKVCGSCISVDTGTMHLANALQVPVVEIFYAWGKDFWASDTNLYPAKVLDNGTPNDIINAYQELMGACV